MFLHDIDRKQISIIVDTFFLRLRDFNVKIIITKP